MSMNQDFYPPTSHPSPMTPEPSSFPPGTEEIPGRVMDRPATPSPLAEINFAQGMACNELLPTVVTLNLEVETVAAKDNFSNEVATALKEALSLEYISCDSPRRRQRRLAETSILLGGVTVTVQPGKHLEWSSCGLTLFHSNKTRVFGRNLYCSIRSC